MTRAASIHQARVYIAQARVRRHQTGFHAALLTWAANCRRAATRKPPRQMEFFLMPHNTSKPDPYASEAETNALLHPDTRTPAEKQLDELIGAESVPELCGSDYPQAMRKAALKLVESVTALQSIIDEQKQCGLCGEQEAFTGRCGGGKRNPAALC